MYTTTADGIALRVAVGSRIKGYFRNFITSLYAHGEPYLFFFFFNLYCSSEKYTKRTTEIKCAPYAQFSFVRKVPVAVNDQTKHIHLPIHYYHHVRTETDTVCR